MILPGHLPDETAVGVHGRPRDGKTTAAMLFAASLSVGRIPYAGTPCPPRNVLVMSNEDSRLESASYLLRRAVTWGGCGWRIATTFGSSPI